MKNVEVRSEGEWAGVFAARGIGRDDRVMNVTGERRSEPDRYSIQVGERVHVYPNGSAWKYLNHSCRPNLIFEADTSGFVARRRIAQGEELTFNYLTTEWTMAEGFACRCGSPSCYGNIAGFAHLQRAAQEELLPVAAPHIRALFEASLQRKTG